MSTLSSSVAGSDFRSGIEDETEKSLLITTDRPHESIRSTRSSSNSDVEIRKFSTTTVIGLLLLLAMITLSILSICLQHYSTNTYVDIIVPPHNSSNGSMEIIPE